MLSIASGTQSELASEEPNVFLAPDEIASLTSLMQQYDQVLVEIDTINARLQELLDIEGPTKSAME